VNNVSNTQEDERMFEESNINQQLEYKKQMSEFSKVYLKAAGTSSIEGR
jgi:hypothetical protein